MRRAAVIAGDDTVKYSRLFPSRRNGAATHVSPSDPETGRCGRVRLENRLKRGLALTGERLKQVAGVFRSHPKIDEALYEALESQLLAADVGVKATAHLVESLRKAARDKRLEDGGQLEQELKASLGALIAPLEKPAGEIRPRPS